MGSTPPRANDFAVTLQGSTLAVSAARNGRTLAELNGEWVDDLHAKLIKRLRNRAPVERAIQVTADRIYFFKATAIRISKTPGRKNRAFMESLRSDMRRVIKSFMSRAARKKFTTSTAGREKMPCRRGTTHQHVVHTRC